MVEKSIDLNELIRLARLGAKIKTEERPTIVAEYDDTMRAPTKIEKFDDLLGKIDAMLEAHKATEKATAARAVETLKASAAHSVATVNADEARSNADKANAQRQLEVLTTLQALIKAGRENKPQAVDLAPLKTVLTAIQKNTPPATNVAESPNSQ